jgi:hypothetical protein
MSLRLFWRCEGTTLDGTHDYSALAGTITPAVQGTVSINSAAARIGSNGILIGAANSHFRFDNSAGASQYVNRLAGAVGFFFRVTDDPSALTAIFNARGINASDFIALQINNALNSAAGIARLSIGSTDTGGATVHVIATGTGLAENTWYWGEIAWDQPNSERGVWIYDTTRTTLLQSATSNAAFVAPLDLNLSTGLRVGEVFGTAMLGHIDNLFVGDAYDDHDLFRDNADISSYTQYDLDEPTISSVGSMYAGQTGVAIAGALFGSTQGSGRVVISPTDNIADVDAEEQTVTSWADGAIAFTVVLGALDLDTNLYVFVENDSGQSNAAGFVKQINSRPYVRETLVDLTGAAVVSEASIVMLVWRANPTTGAPNPNQALTVSTNGAGLLDQVIDRGSLATGDPVWVALLKNGTPARGTLRKVTPVYE